MTSKHSAELLLLQTNTLTGNLTTASTSTSGQIDAGGTATVSAEGTTTTESLVGADPVPTTSNNNSTSDDSPVVAVGLSICHDQQAFG
jgi:hypothetical protein